MLEAEGQRRSLWGLAQTNDDHLALRHAGAMLCRWPVDPGYPMVNDRDAGNPGKGERVVTWRVTLPASLILGNVAEDVQVVDGRGQVVLTEPFPVPVSKEVGKRLLVYVNQHVR